MKERDEPGAAPERLSDAEQFRLLVQGVTDYAIYMLSPSGHIISWNSGAERIKGYQHDQIVGQHFSQFFTPEDKEAGKPQAALARAARDGRLEAEAQRVRSDGSRFWAHVIIDTIYDDHGKIIGFAKITRDITRQKHDADKLQAANRNLDLALSNMSQGLCLFDRQGNLLLSNARSAEIIGVEELTSESTFKDVIALIICGNERRTDSALEDRVNIAVQRHLNMIDRGERRTIVEEFGAGRMVSITHRGIEDGGWLTTLEDVTDRYRAEARISHMAQHDALTGLPNRAHFNMHLKREIEQARRRDQRVAVVGIDLDRFKEINDIHGHAIGDTVLKRLANRLSETIQQNEFISRLSGDEFNGVIRFNDIERLHDFLERIERCLRAPIDIDELKLYPKASIGVALFPNDASAADQLVRNADLAMYRAKSSVGESLCFYEQRMDEAVRMRRALANDLWLALDRGEFELAYQPQKSLITGQTIACEALLRWRHPQRGLVHPADFIPIAEECGAIVRLGEWVLRRACSDAAAWVGQCKVAVNVSPLQLRTDLAYSLQGILRETGLPPHRLEIEITESSLMADHDRCLELLQDIKSMGVTVALDDFGTGYSSLDTLKSFPFDRIKLDKTFLNEVSESPQAKAVIRAILALGRSLAVPVLAEGVETEEQLNLLREEGCDEAQGYLLGKPKIGNQCS